MKTTTKEVEGEVEEHPRWWWKRRRWWWRKRVVTKMRTTCKERMKKRFFRFWGDVGDYEDDDPRLVGQ